MAVNKTTEISLDRRFDSKTCRHSINGAVQVLHCHHYATLYSQLAEDCGLLDGKKLLAEVSEDTFYNVLTDYYREYDVTSIEDRIAIAEQQYSVMGLGKMKVNCAGPDSGEIELETSHVDQGWIKKFGKREQPINFITSGYAAAVFSAVFDRRPRTFSVVETESISCGAPSSKFEVVAN